MIGSFAWRTLQRAASSLLDVLLFAVLAQAQPPPWRAWNEYQTIMWSTGTPRDFPTWVERLRELNFTAEECTVGCDAARFVNLNFGFYVENLVSELAFLHDRKPLYDADWAGYTTTREKKYLIRRPDLSDPDFWTAAKSKVQAFARSYADQKPLLHDLRDELSIGSFASPMDYSFAPASLKAFREWLKNNYDSLDALNREWETAFASWDEVVPMTTYEAKDRERAALSAGKPENYAPWADHRAFMDTSMAGTLARLRENIREVDPATPVGIEGTQMPSAWGGYDLWKLSRAIDWVEPYDIASSREIWRSFLPPGTPILSTVFGSDFPRIRQRLWWLLLHGDRGAIVWDDDDARTIQKSQDGLPVTERGRGLSRILAEMRDAAPLIMPLERAAPPIAIHYSQASIRAHWMFDSRPDRDTWPRRFSSYEAAFSNYARVRDSFQRVVEDLGLQYNFVSYEQIETGELVKAGYKVLMLPQSVAISSKEARAIEDFVRAGGTVIGDSITATMDEHCRRLGKSQLDELFSSAPERAIRVSLDMHDYGKLRLAPPGGAEPRALFEKLLAEAGIVADVKVVDAASGERAPCVEIHRFRIDDGEVIAVMRNPEFNAASLKQAKYPDNSAIETAIKVRILFGREAEAANYLTGAAMGTGIDVEAVLEPWSPLVLRLK